MIIVGLGPDLFILVKVWKSLWGDCGPVKSDLDLKVVWDCDTMTHHRRRLLTCFELEMKKQFGFTDNQLSKASIWYSLPPIVTYNQFIQHWLSEYRTSPVFRLAICVLKLECLGYWMIFFTFLFPIRFLNGPLV
jgi:hypothetical protein